MEFSINLLGDDRSLVGVVGEPPDFKIVFQLLGHDRLVALHGWLATDAAVRPIVAHQGSGSRLVNCGRVWVLIEKRCPVIGS